jgi:hypothetical protein
VLLVVAAMSFFSQLYLLTGSKLHNATVPLQESASASSINNLSEYHGNVPNRKALQVILECWAKAESSVREYTAAGE